MSGVVYWKDGVAYDAQGRRINPGGARQGTPDQNKSVIIDGKEVGRSYGTGLPFSLLADLPGERQFYEGQIGQALRGISAQYNPQRSAILQALESRGLGRSSEVGRSLGQLAGQVGQLGQQAISDVQAQAFAARQQRMNAYIQYMLQKKSQDGGGDVWDLLQGIGSALPYLPWGGGKTSGGYTGSGYSSGTGGSGAGGNPNYPIPQYP